MFQIEASATRPTGLKLILDAQQNVFLLHLSASVLCLSATVNEFS